MTPVTTGGTPEGKHTDDFLSHFDSLSLSRTPPKAFLFLIPPYFKILLPIMKYIFKVIEIVWKCIKLKSQFKSQIKNVFVNF